MIFHNFSRVTYEQYVRAESKDGQKTNKSKKDVPVVIDFVTKAINNWTAEFQLWLTDAQVYYLPPSLFSLSRILSVLRIAPETRVLKRRDFSSLFPPSLLPPFSFAFGYIFFKKLTSIQGWINAGGLQEIQASFRRESHTFLEKDSSCARFTFL